MLASDDFSTVIYPGMKITYSLYPVKDIKFPIKPNEVIGTLIINYGDSSYSMPVVVSQEIKAPSFLDRLRRVL